MGATYDPRIPGRQFFCPRCANHLERMDRATVLSVGRALGWPPGTRQCPLCKHAAPPDWFNDLQAELRPLWNRYLVVRSKDGGRYETTWLRGMIAARETLEAALARHGVEAYRMDDFDDLTVLRAWLAEAEEEDAELAREAAERKLLAAARASGDPRRILAVWHQLHRERELEPKEWREIGELLLEIGDKAQAVRAWQKALADDPAVGVKRKLAALQKQLA